MGFTPVNVALALLGGLCLYTAVKNPKGAPNPLAVLKEQLKDDGGTATAVTSTPLTGVAGSTNLAGSAATSVLAPRLAGTIGTHR